MDTETCYPSKVSANSVAFYVHVPFCKSKCHYCDFTSYAGMSRLIQPYVEAVGIEAAMARRQGDVAYTPPLETRTLFFGGGTPSLLSSNQLSLIIDALPSINETTEATIEVNPATVNIEYLRDIQALGINRLSMGVQSFDDGILRSIGRIHNSAQVMESYDQVRSAGFKNVSMDFIFGLPNQSLGVWRETLHRAIAMQPDHISLYSLTIEEGTLFGSLYQSGELTVPSDDKQANMYLLAEDILERAGFVHYEISNWARERDGKVLSCAHNLVYWHNEPYIGLGVSAHSYNGRRRFANISRVRPYIDAVTKNQRPVISDEEVSREQDMADTMMLGLRLMAGVTEADFQDRFGRSLRDTYGPAIDELVALDLLNNRDGTIYLTKRGRLLGNEVFHRFLAPML